MYSGWCGSSVDSSLTFAAMKNKILCVFCIPVKLVQLMQAQTQGKYIALAFIGILWEPRQKNIIAWL